MNGSARRGSDPEVLRVENLRVTFPTEHGPLVAVDDVSFSLERGSTLGLVGESGSGKTVTSLCLLGMVGASGADVSGSVWLGDHDLLAMDERHLADVRGNEVSMIFQEPRRSLDPAFTVGHQVAEVARRHLQLSRREAWKRAIEMLDIVQIPDAAKRARRYPHQFSGGMCQRVMLALALVARPRVLVADEPTTALDVTIQDHVLTLLEELKPDLDLAVVFVSHDLGVVAQICDRVAVMYAGQVVEEGTVDAVFHETAHPYTQGLLDSLPQAVTDRRAPLPVSGAPPRPFERPLGCRFHPRCPYVQDRCTIGGPELRAASNGHYTRCVRDGELPLEGVG